MRSSKFLLSIPKEAGSYVVRLREPYTIVLSDCPLKAVVRGDRMYFPAKGQGVGLSLAAIHRLFEDLKIELAAHVEDRWKDVESWEEFCAYIERAPSECCVPE